MKIYPTTQYEYTVAPLAQVSTHLSPTRSTDSAVLDYSEVYNFVSGQTHAVLLSASISTTLAGYYDFSGSAHASIDPTFTIDPAYVGASLDFSPEISFGSPVSGVPEPAGGEMMVFGLGVLGAALRRSAGG